MSSQAENLSTSDSNASNSSDGSLIIDNFLQMTAVLGSHDYFREFRINDSQEGSLTISKKNSSIVFIDSSVWTQKDQFCLFNEHSKAGHCRLVCILDQKTDPLKPPILEHQNLSVLPLPISNDHLRFIVNSLYDHQQQLQKIKGNSSNSMGDGQNIRNLLSISSELNGVRDINRLLKLILTRAREITGADAGSIYVVEESKSDIQSDGWVHFKITQNESVYQNLNEFKLPINDSSIVGSSVVHGTEINIPDLYSLKENSPNNPYNLKHDRTWDLKLGYECHSMLTLPMYDISHNVVGVIQLINKKKTQARHLREAKDFKELVIPFDQETVEFAKVVAQQAGIALENALLTEEKEELFEGFVSASVKAIEQRDPTTSGHSHRVAKLTLSLADLVNRTPNGVYGSTRFSQDQLKELEYASLLHDFGKLGVREQVLIKSKKLYPWEFDIINERFEVIRGRIENHFLQEKLNFFKHPERYPPGFCLDNLDLELKIRLQELENAFEMIEKSNEPTVLEQKGFETLKDIANATFRDTKGRERSYLNHNELKALSVSRGSLTPDEFTEIQSHVEHTYEFLRKIPWGRKFANVPQIAAKHHEKLDGSGYPNAALQNEIPPQSRMMTIADIFDALTASDRPYKKSVPVAKALEIIEMEVTSKKCDPDLFKIFVESECYKTVF